MIPIANDVIIDIINVLIEIIINACNIIKTSNPINNNAIKILKSFPIFFMILIYKYKYFFKNMNYNDVKIMLKIINQEIMFLIQQ